MRKTILAGVMGLLAVGGLVLGDGVAANATTGSGDAHGVTARAPMPHMTAALGLLQASQATLKSAASNKGGHRMKALGYVDSAITEVTKGMKYAATHFDTLPVTMRAQPKMKMALARLKEALQELKLAKANKGGHRVKAIQMTEKAIAEVNAGIRYADKGK